MKTLTAHPGMFTEDKILETKISFAPFVRFLKAKAADTNDTRSAFYQYIVEKFEQHPDMLGPISPDTNMERYKEFLDLVVASIFPVTIDAQKDIFAIGAPMKFAIIYYSDLFKRMFASNGIELTATPPGIPITKIKRDRMIWLYKLILERVYNFPVNYENEIIHQLEMPDTGLKRYMKVNIDPRFVDVKVKGDLPPLNYNNICTHQTNLDCIQQMLPLELFSLEGFVVWTVEDVTQTEVLNEIKALVMNMRDDNEAGSYHTLEKMIPAMLGVTDISAHVVPFPKINGEHVMEDQFIANDPILGIGNKKQQQLLFNGLKEHIQRQPYPLVIPDVTESSILPHNFLKFLPHKGIRSFILFPIMYKNELLGILELASVRAGAFSQEPLGNLQNVYPLLVLMLNRSLSILNGRINQVIKQQFTALQPAVEWKFTDAAWQYLITPEAERKDIENITFDDVYPLYGAIDIRNSSIEQGNAIRDDLQEQLYLIHNTLTAVSKEIHLPLLEELLYKTDSLLQNLSENLQAGEDVKVNEFMDYEVAPVLQHLHESSDSLRPVLETYFSKVDKSEGHVFHHRREYEESLAQMNTAIGQYLEKERHYIQQSFPCYFEKYRTDGVEYTIYIGQSIAKEKKFDLLYLRNLRLWQLSSMAAIARMTHKLSPQQKISLQTTQLILMHSAAITISFRSDERRFDVEGAYNIRYEIIKKRIDKVHVKGTGERLTQPGAIAIVYSHIREMEELRKYVHFLQSKNILMPGMELLDLEELQGVSGLKAMRVQVNLDYEEPKA